MKNNYFATMSKKIINLVILFSLMIKVIQSISLEPVNQNNNNNGKCEEITVPMCRNMEYNMTSMPNSFNHETQAEAAMEAHQFWALVEINCAKELRFFLCSLYTPICMPNYPQRIKACKSVCIRARVGCEKYMKKYGFEWPDHMNCDLFPEYGSTKEVCMDPMDQEQQNKKKLTINHNLSSNKKKMPTSSTTSSSKSGNSLVNEQKQDSLLDVMCQKPFLKIVSKTTDSRFNKISIGGLVNCVQSCKSVYFNEWQQLFSYYWLSIWTIICLASSLCTTFTFLIDSSRFKYPERPIIYLSICYLFVSCGYLIRLIVGHEKMACESDNSAKYEINDIMNNSTNLTCYLSFVLIYFFGMASCVWWIVISLTWFLAAGLKWGTEAIAKYSNYFHLVAWGLPFIQTMIVLIITRSVDADPLTGLCYVGNLSTQNLRIFVILPSMIYLLIGITFLIAGFISLFRIRNMIKQQNGVDSIKAQKIEKLMLRIGVFSILYTVPATCVIACQFYEQLYRSDWEKNMLCKQARLDPQNDATIIQEYCGLRIDSDSFSESPEFLVFMIKHLMSLIVGITSGFWILSKKTILSWSIFIRKLFCCCFSLHESKRNRNRKDSIVYFQANDDIENNPHNLLYNSTSSSQSSQKQQQQVQLGQQKQQQLLNNNSSIIYQSNLESNQNLIKQSNTTNTTSGSIPESFECLPNQHTNNNTNNNNLYLPQYNHYQIQNCHLNKAAAFYYDYSSSNSKNNELTSVSSKYSFQSK